MESGANLARIYREYHERDVYLTEQAENGVKDVTVPMLRPDFETKYSDGYNSDITASPEYWLNIAYARIMDLTVFPVSPGKTGRNINCGIA